MSLIARTAPFALVLVALTSAAAHAQQPALKIAYVNTRALLDNAPGATAAESTLAREADTYRAELKRMNDSVQTLITAFNKSEPTLSQTQKDAKAKQIQDLEQALQARNTQLQQQAQQRQNELMAPITEQVRKVLDDIRQEDGYAVIFANDPGATPIVSADKNLDITERVVARLRTLSAAKAPPKPAAVPSPSGAVRPKPPTE